MAQRGEAGGAGEPLAAQLEAAALRALRAAFDELNADLFRNALRRPLFELGESRSRLGGWHGARRGLELSRRLLLEQGWGAVIEVLKHELAHQYTDEVLGAGGEPPHGPSFQAVCRERGIDARACGDVVPAGPPHPVLERVAKLLALAHSPHEHEAQAAARAAQRIMLRHNLEEQAQGTQGGCGFRQLGEPSGRIREAERTLAGILADHFFVDAIWVPVWRVREGKRGSVLEVCGRPENLEIAAYVHAYLLHVAEQLWLEHARVRAVRGRGDRQAFRAGVMSGFAERLRAERAHNREQGLVWVGDPGVRSYLRARHPRIEQLRRGSSAGTAAHGAGRGAGRRIVLRRALGSEASPAAPRALPAGPRPAPR